MTCTRDERLVSISLGVKRIEECASSNDECRCELDGVLKKADEDVWAIVDMLADLIDQ